MVRIPEPDAMLCFNLYATSHAFTRYYKRVLAPLGLTYPQYLVMLRLGAAQGEQEPQNVGSLSRDLCLETNTLSPLLKRIEAMGLIRRIRSAADERRVDLILTDSGCELARRCADIPRQIMAELDLDAEEIARCSATLLSLRARLSESDGGASGAA